MKSSQLELSRFREVHTGPHKKFLGAEQNANEEAKIPRKNSQK